MRTVRILADGVWYGFPETCLELTEKQFVRQYFAAIRNCAGDRERREKAAAIYGHISNKNT